MVNCPECGTNNSDNLIFCSNCGAPLPKPSQPKNICPNCGLEQDDSNQMFCSGCGFKLGSSPSSNNNTQNNFNPNNSQNFQNNSKFQKTGDFWDDLFNSQESKYCQNCG